MKVAIKKSVKVTLELSECEAIWLKALMQNPIGGVSPADEDEGDRRMRKTFWKALGDVGPNDISAENDIGRGHPMVSPQNNADNSNYGYGADDGDMPF